jgi:hypothetical protein
MEGHPVNKRIIKPTWTNIARLTLKLLLYPLGNSTWSRVEANIFQYSMDELRNSSIVPYHKVLFDNRGQRHWASWWAEIYLMSKGFDQIDKNFPASYMSINQKNEFK